MIVEYFGIPGCGKTYQANLYKKELERKGIAYIDLSRWKGTPLWLKIFFKVTDKLFVIWPKYRNMRCRLRNLCKDVYSKKKKYLPFSVNYCIDRIISSVFLEDVFGNCNKIAINDEGLMQWVIFLNVQYGVEISDILLYIEPFNCQASMTFIDTHISNALDNIRKRNRHICPMDEMEDMALKGYLEDFYSACVHTVSLLNSKRIMLNCTKTIISVP